jgi:hypothetical protein
VKTGFSIGRAFVSFSSQWRTGVFTFIGTGYIVEEGFDIVARGVHLTVLGLAIWFGWWSDAKDDNSSGAAPAMYRTINDWRHAFRGAEGGKVS